MNERHLRLSRMAATALLAGLTAGCLVEIDRVADPGPAFAQARREAARYQGRSGPAHYVNVLVYDHDEGQLVRVSVPMWLARKVARDKDGLDLDLGDGRAERTVRRHLRFEDLERAGLGVLVEVEEEGGDLVLVWLK
jgi:hypothetical protein